MFYNQKHILLMGLCTLITLLSACTKDQTNKMPAVIHHNDPYSQEYDVTLPANNNQKKAFSKKNNGIELIDTRHINLEK